MKYLNLFILLVLTTSMFFACDFEKVEQYPLKLEGLNIQYKYANDREYNVKLEKDGLSYRYVSGSKPDKWWGKFPYHHHMLEDDLHVVAWHEKDYDDYVTLIINFDENTLFGSGIIRGEEVHFQPALIRKMNFE